MALLSNAVLEIYIHFMTFSFWGIFRCTPLAGFSMLLLAVACSIATATLEPTIGPTLTPTISPSLAGELVLPGS
jgi:hypothetical protein